MPEIKTNDDIRLHYEEQGEGRPLVLIHGWTFSGRFFVRNVEALAERFRVITLDLRGHGNSDKPAHGYRIPRLARDLYDLLEALDLTDTTVLGWSLGCPVIWSYLELFGAHRLSGAVFVQQTPRQYIGADWPYYHAVCYDDAGLATLQAQVSADPAGQDLQQLQTILATEPNEQDRGLFLSEMAKSPPEVRNAVMADHTRHDWRDLLPTIRIPSLVLVARQDEVFPWQGPAYVGEAIPGAQTAYFDESSHALFFDEPEKFNETVASFVGSLESASAAQGSASREPGHA